MSGFVPNAMMGPNDLDAAGTPVDPVYAAKIAGRFAEAAQNAAKDTWDLVSLPGDIARGAVSSDDPRLTDWGPKMAFNLFMAGMPGAEGGAAGIFGGKLAQTAEGSALGNSVASKSARMYDAPAKPPRPFEADYPSGAPSDAAGNLTHDIDGRPLTAPYIAGRTSRFELDQAIAPAQYDTITAQTIGALLVGRAPGKVRGGGVGAFTRVAGSNGPEYGIEFDRTLSPNSQNRVVAHEMGHMVDTLSSHIDSIGVEDQLRKVYNTLNNPNRATVTGRRHGVETGEAARGPLFGPENNGYRGENVQRELMAEALRACMADPNYLKSVAPEAAKTIRGAVNSNPRINQTIQFNTGAQDAKGAATGAVLSAAEHGSRLPRPSRTRALMICWPRSSG